MRYFFEKTITQQPCLFFNMLNMLNFTPLIVISFGIITPIQKYILHVNNINKGDVSNFTHNGNVTDITLSVNDLWAIDQSNGTWAHYCPQSKLEVPWQVLLVLVGFISIFWQIYMNFSRRTQLEKQHKMLESWIGNAASRFIWGSKISVINKPLSSVEKTNRIFLKANFIKISNFLWSFFSSELIEILSEIMDMTYLPAVSFLNVVFNNGDDANVEKGIVKGLFFYLVFLWCILFEVFVSKYYYARLRYIQDGSL